MPNTENESCSTEIMLFLGAVVGTAVVGGALFAGFGAASGWAGASILKAAGCAGFLPSTATTMGAIGGAIEGSVLGAGYRLFAPCRSQNSQNKNNTNFLTEVKVAAAGAVLAGLTGYGVMSSLDLATGMNLANTAASFAVGGPVTLISLTIAMIAIAMAIAMAIAALCFVCKKESESPDYRSEFNFRAFQPSRN